MSLQMRMARAAMDSEYGDYGDQGDPGLGSIIRGAGKFFGKAGKIFGKALPVVGTAIGIGGAAYGLLRKKPKLLGPGLPTTPSQFPMPVLFDQPMGFQQPSGGGFPALPGGGFQLPRGRAGGAEIDFGGFQLPQRQQPQAPVGRPGQPTGQQVCGDGVVRNTRLNKSGYFTYQQGRAAKPIQWVAPGTKCVATRKMNPLNPRALSRAVGRVMSAKRASKLINRVSVRSSCPTRRGASRAKGSCKKR